MCWLGACRVFSPCNVVVNREPMLQTFLFVEDVYKRQQLAAENQLMVNIHDEYRPSGFSRTYPNLLTQEGIRGNEEFPDATHNTIPVSYTHL